MSTNQNAAGQSRDSTTSNPAFAKPEVTSRSGQPTQDEDGFIDIHHEDVDMQDSDSDATAPPQKTSLGSLDLQRISHSDKADEVPEDEDDSDDDHDLMANHPLLNMLSGRLGQRRRGSAHKWDSLHPENQALSAADLDQCSSLEDETFSVEERASREKVRLSKSWCSHGMNKLNQFTDNASHPVSISTHQMSRAELGALHPAYKGRIEGLVNATSATIDGACRLDQNTSAQRHGGFDGNPVGLEDEKILAAIAF